MPTYPLATIPGTEARTLRSLFVNQEYLISIALPFTCAEIPEKRYPVIYMLDANMYFGMVVEMARTLSIRVPFCSPFPALNSRGYADFTLTYEVIPKYTHCAVVAPALLAGLVVVFSEP